MITILILLATGTTSNLILRNKKKKKAIEEAMDMFNKHGYYVSDHDIKKLLKYQFGKNDRETLDNAFSDYRELILQFIPLINYYYILQNIKFLNNMESSQDFYHNYGKWELYNRTIDDGITPLQILKDEINLKPINIIDDNDKPNSISFGNNATIYNKSVNRDVSKLVLKPNQNK